MWFFKGLFFFSISQWNAFWVNTLISFVNKPMFQANVGGKNILLCITMFSYNWFGVLTRDSYGVIFHCMKLITLTVKKIKD